MIIPPLKSVLDNIFAPPFVYYPNIIFSKDPLFCILPPILITKDHDCNSYELQKQLEFNINEKNPKKDASIVQAVTNIDIQTSKTPEFISNGNVPIRKNKNRGGKNIFR